jgi:poly(A) polymerase
MAPTIIPRAEHRISRREIDPDALKVLYRLRQHDHIAYLVGGSVRDLLLGRRPKDFDIGTSAHPAQVKRLFRNCWIIGRRFRLAHVKFGPKTIEVATFRRQVPPGTEEEPPVVGIDVSPNGNVQEDIAGAGDWAGTPNVLGPRLDRPPDRLIHRDNTFGTPEEDAFRRDFTINALFYDIATFAVIDYVGGLEDLKAQVIRSIGDPDERFLEDPVRMVRAVALAARLDFAVDAPVREAIQRHRAEIMRSAPARVLEEYYKILRSGAAERTFRGLAEAGLLQHISPELQPGETLWTALRSIDVYRSRFDAIPDTLTNPILLGTLLLPESRLRHRRRHDMSERTAEVEAGPSLGRLPIPRRDLERLRHIIALQRRLLDFESSPRAQRALAHRSAIGDALTWLEIHGQAADAVAHWRALLEELAPAGLPQDVRPSYPRRRRRRRSFRRPPPPT